MKRFWFELKGSETHKAHLIFQHAADDQDEFGGLGDKGEDDWERRHQVQGKFDHILHRMCGGWQKQISTQLKYEWRNNDPKVEEQIENVNEKNIKEKETFTRYNFEGGTICQMQRRTLQQQKRFYCS